MKTLRLDSPRIRFNHGFWDGISDRDNKRRNRVYVTRNTGGFPFPLPVGHEWKAYREGYEAGFHWEGETTTSQPAWEARNN